MQIEIVRINVKVPILADEAAVDAAIVGVADSVKLLRITDRKRLQQNSLHQGEDCCVCANAERQRDDGRRRETWRLTQLPQSVAKILK